MAIQNYYILTSLPVLEQAGMPAITPSELWDKVEMCEGPAELIQAIILGDDLIKMQALLSEEIEDADFTILTNAQAKGEEPMPDFLLTTEEPARKVPVDSLWENYFKHSAKTAVNCGSNFLRKWVNFEVSLRNALVLARAKKLGFEAFDFVASQELSDDEYDFDSLVNEWSSASNPLSGLEVLDTARWQWVSENESWYSFSDDELAAYTSRLLLINRRCRLTQAESN